MARTSTKAADVVTVACKLPQGLRIKLDGKPDDVVLNGQLSAFALAGYGMTDVKKDVWDAVTKQYADAAWLKNEAVFAMADRDSVVDKAADSQEVKTGFEPVDPAASRVITPAA